MYYFFCYFVYYNFFSVIIFDEWIPKNILIDDYGPESFGQPKMNIPFDFNAISLGWQSVGTIKRV